MAQEAWPLLADFSLVKIANTDSPLTRSGMVMGTPAYISPEQANGDLVDRRADIYALGVVLFEMITGRLPFVYSNPNMLMLAHISEPVPSPCALNPACPPELERVILTALQKSPDDRYSNMQAMIEAFIYVTGASTVSFSGQSPAKRPFRSTEPSLTKPPARPETSQGPRLVLSTQNVSLELPNPPRAGLILGRSHGSVQADVDLGPYEAAAAGVSRQHARLTHSNQAWFIEDLNSLNGTYVNEVKLTPGRPALLKHGDVVRCSRLSLVFLLPEN
jgi:serine/threonine protein kinase